MKKITVFAAAMLFTIAVSAQGIITNNNLENVFANFVPFRVVPEMVPATPVSTGVVLDASYVQEIVGVTTAKDVAYIYESEVRSYSVVIDQAYNRAVGKILGEQLVSSGTKDLSKNLENVIYIKDRDPQTHEFYITGAIIIGWATSTQLGMNYVNIADLVSRKRNVFIIRQQVYATK